MAGRPGSAIQEPEEEDAIAEQPATNNNEEKTTEEALSFMSNKLGVFHHHQQDKETPIVKEDNIRPAVQTEEVKPPLRSKEQQRVKVKKRRKKLVKMMTNRQERMSPKRPSVSFSFSNTTSNDGNDERVEQQEETNIELNVLQVRQHTKKVFREINEEANKIMTQTPISTTILTQMKDISDGVEIEQNDELHMAKSLLAQRTKRLTPTNINHTRSRPRSPVRDNNIKFFGDDDEEEEEDDEEEEEGEGAPETEDWEASVEIEQNAELRLANSLEKARKLKQLKQLTINDTNLSVNDGQDIDAHDILLNRRLIKQRISPKRVSPRSPVRDHNIKFFGSEDEDEDEEEEEEEEEEEGDDPAQKYNVFDLMAEDKEDTEDQEEDQEEDEEDGEDQDSAHLHASLHLEASDSWAGPKQADPRSPASRKSQRRPSFKKKSDILTDLKAIYEKGTRKAKGKRVSYQQGSKTFTVDIIKHIELRNGHPGRTFPIVASVGMGVTDGCEEVMFGQIHPEWQANTKPSDQEIQEIKKCCTCDVIVSINGRLIKGGTSGYIALLRDIEDNATSKEYRNGLSMRFLFRRDATIPGIDQDVLDELRSDHAIHGPRFDTSMEGLY